MTTDDHEGLPEADTPAEVLGSMFYVLHSLGRELGERYDTHLRASIGPNWVQGLANIRKHYINKYDPHFVLAEPLKFPDSPTRACLPSGGAFYNQLEDALEVRNSWSHYEVTPLDLAALKAGISTIHAFATSAEMRLGKLCSQISKRINAIANGSYPPAGTQPFTELAGDIEALMSDLAQARANEQALKDDVVAAQHLLEEAAREGSVKASLEARLDTLQQKLDEALDEKQKLEFVIEALASTQSTAPVQEDPPVKAIPGHPWRGSVPLRSVTMMSLHADLFDPATGSRVAEQFGPHAQTVIASWKATIGPNATVLLTPLGQAVTYINGVPIYLGTLAATQGPAQSGPQLAGFFIPYSYTLRMNGSIEDRDSGETLADVNPAAAPMISQRLLERIPTGGRLRVTTSGGVARHRDGSWVVVADVARSQWFPGHL